METVPVRTVAHVLITTEVTRAHANLVGWETIAKKVLDARPFPPTHCVVAFS